MLKVAPEPAARSTRPGADRSRDAAAKGVEGFDLERAYAAVKHSARLQHFGLDAYARRGYISSEDEPESVSKTLEYAYDDWC